MVGCIKIVTIKFVSFLNLFFVPIFLQLRTLSDRYFNVDMKVKLLIRNYSNKIHIFIKNQRIFNNNDFKCTKTHFSTSFEEMHKLILLLYRNMI